MRFCPCVIQSAFILFSEIGFCSFMFAFFGISWNSVAENKNRASAYYLYQHGGVKATRILPLVLVCIVALAAASTIGFALWSNAIQHLEIAAQKGTFSVQGYAEAISKNIRIRGDPIDNPKPNNL